MMKRHTSKLLIIFSMNLTDMNRQKSTLPPVWWVSSALQQPQQQCDQLCHFLNMTSAKAVQEYQVFTNLYRGLFGHGLLFSAPL